MTLIQLVAIVCVSLSIGALLGVACMAVLSINRKGGDDAS